MRRPTGEVRRDARYWIEVGQLTVVGAIARILDMTVLCLTPRLFVANLRLLLLHLRNSPYRWPSSFETVRALSQAKQGRRELVYGETPVFTAKRLFKTAGLGKGMRFADLCAGRGRALLGAAALGGEAIGFELSAERAAGAPAILSRVGISLRIADGTVADLSEVDVAYVTWTGFSDEAKRRFEHVASSLRHGAHLLCADRPYEGEGFVEVGRTDALCTWGVVPVWIYRRET